MARVNYKWHTFILRPNTHLNQSDVNKLIDRVTRSNIFGNRLDARVGKTNSVTIYKQSTSETKTRTLPNKDKEEYKVISTQYLTEDSSIKSVQYVYVEFYDPQWKIFKTVEEYPHKSDLNAAINELMNTGNFYTIVKGKLTSKQVEDYLKQNGHIAVDKKEEVIRVWKYIPPKTEKTTESTTEKSTTEEGTYTLESGIIGTGEGTFNIGSIVLIGVIALLLFLMIRK